MNFLIIFSDQQHKYSLNRVDSTFKTPNLDKLCQDGVLFKNAYSPNPVCGPFRGCLMTGQYTSRCCVYNNGDPLPKGTRTLAEVFQDAGYETSFVGKWHLGATGNIPVPQDLRGGFRHFIAYQCYNGFDPDPPFNNDVCFFDEENKKHIYKKHRTDVTTELAIERLCMLKRTGKPFLSVVGYQAPHYPEQPSEEFSHLYDGVIFKKEPNYKEIDPFTRTVSPHSPDDLNKDPDYQRYGNNMDRYQQLYAGLVSQIDNGVGRILDALEEMNLMDDTMVIYTSDHGDMQGTHGLKNKCLPYEKSCGIPFIVKFPSGRRNVTCDKPVSALDIFPTLLKSAGLPNSLALDGHSFYDYIVGNKEELDDCYVISECFLQNPLKYPWRMIRDERYKLVVDANTDKVTMLYDMKKDPYEMNNLKDDINQKARITKLKTILKERTCELLSNKEYKAKLNRV